MVAAGNVRARAVCLRLCALGIMFRACVFVLRVCHCVRSAAVFGCVVMLRSAEGVRAVRDGVQRCCGV